MTVTLYRKPDFKDPCYTVTGDVSDLSRTPVKRAASSMRMTSNTDRVLLFKNRLWRGNAMFRTGAQDISRLGSPSKGGKTLFGDSVASVRTSPFAIRLFINIICKDDGSFPGFRASDEDIETGAGTDGFPAFITDVLAGANAI
jgi:hypothetical protein